MANIPPDKDPFSTSSSRPAEDPSALLQKDAALTKVSSIAQSILTQSTDSTRSTAALNRDVTENIKSLDEEPPELAVSWPNEPSKLLQKQDSELKDLFLNTLKAPYPPFDVLQSIITKIEDVDTLLEIWTELIIKPEDDSLEDLLVEVFQAIYQKNRDSSYEAYFRTGQRIKIKKGIADCLKANDLEFFFNKVIQTNDRFSIVLFLRKITAGKTKYEFMMFLEPFKLSEPDQVQRICYPLLSINWETPFTFDYLSFKDFQYLCVDFCASGWGTKEEFLTKALCCFWNRITCLPGPVMKIFLDRLENGILDIGTKQDPTLSEGNYELYVLLFSVGILYPTIQEKIETRTPTTFHLKADELERDYTRLETDSQIFIDKIRTLFLPPEEAIKNLEEVDPLDTESFPCTRAKHPQFSGSCAVKNLNSLLSMCSRAPSIIMYGGFKYHAVYAEVFRLGDQYFALVHNLGGGSESHFVDERNKILPLALYFENKDRLMAFSRNFCRSGSGENYLNYVEFFALNSRNKNIEKEFDRLQDESSIPFAKSLVYPDKTRTNPMYPEYQKFRRLQKEIIRMLIDPTGSPSEVKAKASDVRKIQKGQARGDQ